MLRSYPLDPAPLRGERIGHVVNIQGPAWGFVGVKRRENPIRAPLDVTQRMIGPNPIFDLECVKQRQLPVCMSAHHSLLDRSPKSLALQKIPATRVFQQPTRMLHEPFRGNEATRRWIVSGLHARPIKAAPLPRDRRTGRIHRVADFRC
jgi:hypothetical protein